MNQIIIVLAAASAFAVTAAAQTSTTFTMAVPQRCTIIDACTYEGLFDSGGDSAYLAIGWPATQLVYHVPGNPNGEAQYCDGGTFTSSEVPGANGSTVFIRDCDSNSEGVQGYNNGHLHWEVTATFFEMSGRCGKWPCTLKWWAIDSMFVTVTIEDSK